MLPLWSLAAAGVIVEALAGTAPPVRAETLSLPQLAQQTHVHGLAVDRESPSHLLIATHHGLFRAGPDGIAERVSEVQDFMGFNPHPKEPNTLYASGHPAQGGNLGFIASTDRGKTWKQLSRGVNGPVDFHQMSVSPADPNTIYGSYRGLQVSRDGGKSWRLVGPPPDGLIDLAASAEAADRLYAATENGLLVSDNGGMAWKPLLENALVSVVEVAPDGALYAFVLGRGLVRSGEKEARFETVAPADRDEVFIHLAIDPNDPNRLFAATDKGAILASADRGSTWTRFGAR